MERGEGQKFPGKIWHLAPGEKSSTQVHIKYLLGSIEINRIYGKTWGESSQTLYKIFIPDHDMLFKDLPYLLYPHYTVFLPIFLEPSYDSTLTTKIRYKMQKKNPHFDDLDDASYTDFSVGARGVMVRHFIPLKA